MMKTLLATAAMAVIAASPAAAAISIGDTIELAYLFPDTSNAFEVQTGTYTGTTFSLVWFGTGTASFDANLITLDQTPGCGSGCGYTNAAFNGVRITNLTNAAAFAGWAELPGATTNPHTTTFSGGSIFVNWQGAPVEGVIQIGGSAVPEPQSWALMIAGFGLVGAAARRRRNATVAA